MRMTGHGSQGRCALKKIPGVPQYGANQFTHALTIKFDDTKASIDKIVEGLAKEDLTIQGQPKIIR